MTCLTAPLAEPVESTVAWAPAIAERATFQTPQRRGLCHISEALDELLGQLGLARAGVAASKTRKIATVNGRN